MTFFFLIVILGATDRRAPAGFAPIAIGLGLTLIHLISIPVTNTSVNPARSTGPALFVRGWALQQFWLFWVAPISGGRRGRNRLSARCEGVARLRLGTEAQPRVHTRQWTVGRPGSSMGYLRGARFATHGHESARGS